MRLWIFLLAGFAFGTAVVAEEDIWTKTINNDSNGVWNVQPDKPKAKYFAVEGIPGGHAFRIKANKGANPWDVQASSPVNGAINEGDVIMLLYYARAAEPAEGGSSLTARIQATAAAVDRDDGHDLEDHRASGRATARIASPARRCRRAACPFISPPPGRSSSSARCSCSISARAIRPTSSRGAMARDPHASRAAVRELCLAFPGGRGIRIARLA